MRNYLRPPLLLVVLLALVLSACGGSASIPKDAVAKVADTLIQKASLDALITQAQKSYKT